jgi:hypothetical protein
MDAITELTNNFGDEASLQTLSEATKDYPDRLLRKLTVLDSVLTWWYCGWWMPPTGPKQVEEGKLLKMANVVKEKTCHGVPSHLPDDKTSKETWTTSVDRDGVSSMSRIKERRIATSGCRAMLKSPKYRDT